MASQSTWTKVGRVTKNHDNYKAEVDTYCLGERYKFTGPPRGSDEHKAYDDLLRIRASAEQALTRPEGLELMKSMARLQAPGQLGGSTFFNELGPKITF